MSADRRHANVANVDEVQPVLREQGSRFGLEYRNLSNATGAKGVGCTLYEVPPGRAAFPMHYHCANEEAIFVLEGEGSLRIGADTVPVRAGDFITFPTGPDHAHQLVNDGAVPLRYLCMSTLLTTDVVGYTDSGKIGAFSHPHGHFSMPWVRALFRTDSQVDYWYGEDTEKTQSS